MRILPLIAAASLVFTTGCSTASKPEYRLGPIAYNVIDAYGTDNGFNFEIFNCAGQKCKDLTVQLVPYKEALEPHEVKGKCYEAANKLLENEKLIRTLLPQKITCHHFAGEANTKLASTHYFKIDTNFALTN